MSPLLLLLLSAPGLELDLVRGSPDCPDEATLRAQVAELTELGPGPPIVAARVELRGPPWRAVVRFSDGAERSVSGESCPAVAQAAALILSLRIDATPPPSPPAPPPPAPPPRTVFHPVRSGPEPAPTVATPKISVRGQVGALFGALPRPALALELSAGLTTGAFRAELGALHLPRQTRGDGSGARFRLFAGVARLCGRQALSGVDLLLCASVTAGVVQAEGFGVDEPASAGPVWLSGGATLGCVVPLAGPFRLVPAVVGEFPMARPTFTLDGMTLHRPAPWMVSVGVGGEVVF